MNSRPRRLLLSLFCVSLFFRTALVGATKEDNRQELFDSLIDSGLYALYNLDYEKALSTFQKFREEFPRHPFGPYAITTTHWWELTNEFDENNPFLEKQFLETAEETAEFARQRIKENDKTGEAHLCLGGALGLMSRWDAINGHWLSAYRHGRQAFKAQKKAIGINPNLYDAYLGVGIFHYYTATLPAVVKFLAKLIFGGNKEQGLREIHWAMEKGRFSRTAAKLFLIGIYNNTEKDYAAALKLVRAGREEFPDSSFFHFLEILTLENKKDGEGVRREAQSFLSLVREGKPSYRESHTHRAYLALGNSYLSEGNALEALKFYDHVIEEFSSEDRWVSLTYLNRGKAWDLLKKRKKALENYRIVLSRRDVWGLHDQAKELMDRPDP